jgi:hypothetical protein
MNGGPIVIGFSAPQCASKAALSLLTLLNSAAVQLLSLSVKFTAEP